jgi:hypothetical protein
MHLCSNYKTRQLHFSHHANLRCNGFTQVSDLYFEPFGIGPDAIHPYIPVEWKSRICMDLKGLWGCPHNHRISIKYQISPPLKCRDAMYSVRHNAAWLNVLTINYPKSKTSVI